MVDNYQDPSQQYFFDLTTRIKDLEERQKLLRERILLIGQNLINERESTFKEMQEMKKMILVLKEDNLRAKDFIQRMSEQFSDLARKEELLIVKRQLDMLEPHIKKEEKN